MTQELEIYIQARYPLIYVVSWEEDRILKVMDDIAVHLRKMLLSGPRPGAWPMRFCRNSSTNPNRIRN